MQAPLRQFLNLRNDGSTLFRLWQGPATRFDRRILLSRRPSGLLPEAHVGHPIKRQEAFATMSITGFIDPSQIRAQFSSAMSAMYRTEVPLYGDLLDLSLIHI